MDIGEMGGGDALLAKIDAGIRDCKVSKSDFLVLNSSDCASDAVIFKTLHRQPALKITHVATLAKMTRRDRAFLIVNHNSPFHGKLYPTNYLFTSPQ